MFEFQLAKNFCRARIFFSKFHFFLLQNLLEEFLYFVEWFSQSPHIPGLSVSRLVAAKQVCQENAVSILLYFTLS